MRPTEKPDDPLSRFSFAVFELNGLLMRNGDRITRAAGQSSARWQILGRAGYQPRTVAQMAREMGLARQSVQRVADALEADGLVAYAEHPGDRRTRLVELTGRGADVLAAIYDGYAAWSRQIMPKLDAPQLDALAEALERIAGILHIDVDERE